MHRWRAAAIIAAITIAGAAATPTACAQGNDAPMAVRSVEDRQRAAVLFDRSAIAYRDGRYDAAVVMLREAHELSGEPILLYNLGRAYEGVRDEESALEAYRGFVRAVDGSEPEGEPSVATVRAAIDRLERVLAVEEATTRLPVTLASSSTAQRRARAPSLAPGAAAPEMAPWALVLGGAAGVAAGGVLAGLAVERRETASADPEQVGASDAWNEAQAMAIGASVAFAVGGALAGAGLVWGIANGVGGSRGEVEVEVAVGLGGVVVRGAF